MKNFNEFISQLAPTNTTLGSLVDFDKVRRNTQQIEVDLNILNYLLGKDNLQAEVEYLFASYPSAFNVLGILVAVRNGHACKVLGASLEVSTLKSFFNSSSAVMDFLTGTGLDKVFKDKNIKNLVDYVFGIEVGLDTNARKNRGGDSMVKAITQQFNDANINFSIEVSSAAFPEINSLGVDLKVFDFVVRTKSKTYLIEVNFYNTGGSKLNEVARAYTILNDKIKNFTNYSFVWITDGVGWLTAKNKLEEAYTSIEHVYNLTTLQDFIKTIEQ